MVHNISLREKQIYIKVTFLHPWYVYQIRVTSLLYKDIDTAYPLDEMQRPNLGGARLISRAVNLIAESLTWERVMRA